MIQINKQLQRPDKGTLASGSIIDFTTIFPTGTLSVRYNLIHWFNQLAKDEDGWLPVAGVTNFSYIMIKECTEEEYAQLNEAGSADLVQLWLKELIDAKIGAGNTIII
jgi:hypothetical protein